MKLLYITLLVNFMLVPSCMNEEYLVDDILIKNEGMMIGNTTANDDSALSFASTNDFARGKKPFDESKPKDSSNGLGYIPLGLLALVIIVPLVLMPILFLFTRRSGLESLDDDTPDLFHILDVDYTLLPTDPSGDPILRDKSFWSDIVRVNSKHHPFYRLTPQNAFIRSRTGQLYHNQSGLLFTPLPGCTFNVQTGRLHFDDSHLDHTKSLPAHLVYEEDTHCVYEPTLSLVCNGHKWHLAVAPSDKVAHVQPIRRAETNELPKSLQQIYADLLANGNASVPQNPLIVSKIDFSKLQPADMMTTPRGSIESVKMQCTLEEKSDFKEAISQTV